MIWFCLISFHTSDFNYFRMTGSLQNGVERPIANFLEYCRNGDLGGARFALKAGVDVNSRVMRRGFSGLMIAMSKNHNAMGRLLLEQAGVDVNMDCNGSTALHYAVHGNNAEGLRMLLDRQDLDCVNRVDKLDCTPLKLALAYNSVDCLSLLLADKRCDSNIKDDWDLTTLMFAVKNDVPSCLSLLLEAPQVDPNLKNKREGSPLMMAVKMNKTKVLPLLLACPRIDLDTRDNHKRSRKEMIRCQDLFVLVFGCALQSSVRFVEENAEQVSDVLEDLVYSEESSLFPLRLIWGSGFIKEKIMEEVTRQLKVTAKLGRTLEQAARLVLIFLFSSLFVASFFVVCLHIFCIFVVVCLSSVCLFLCLVVCLFCQIVR